MTKKIFLVLTSFYYLMAFSQNGKVETFPLNTVRLLNGPFKNAQDVDLKYIMSLDADKLLAPYCKDAGIESKAENYGNWESSGLDGHTLGHYISALAMMYAATGDKNVLAKLEYTISVLAKCQDKNGNGYVGGIPDSKQLWDDLAKGKLVVDNFSVNKRWVPWYNIHKLFAGLRDAYLFTSDKKALDILVKLSNWCVTTLNGLTDDQMQQMMRCEHGGMNEVLADVYLLTNDKKYLDAAKRFSHKAILEPLEQQTDKLNGLHANTQIPKVIGFEQISEITGDTSWHRAATFFWETVVHNRSVAIGGNSVREHFHPSSDFSSMIEDKEGPETCNTYNMLRLSKMLYQNKPEMKYLDFYERGMYNHILSSEHPQKGGFVYFTPMRPQHYRVYSQPQQCFWCCVGSGMENHSKYGELIYTHSPENLYVNFYIASQLSWSDKGLKLNLETTFPESDKSVIKLNLTKSQKFTINLRYPSWVANGEAKVWINGKSQQINSHPGDFIALTNKWKSGDQIEIELPMHVYTEYLPDKSPWAAILYGPLVFAAKTDTLNLDGLFANDSRMGHIAAGKLYPIENAPILVTSEHNFENNIKPVAGKTLTLSASAIVYPAKFKSLELIPFYKVHDSRYVIYWQVIDPQNLEKQKQELAEKEKKQLELESQTIDQIAPGEQQPESDHNMKSERSNSGVNMDMHWRDASGWFSYDLKDVNNEARKIQITYFGLDRGRTFDIVVNNIVIATETLDGSMGSKFFTRDYILPEEVLKKDKETRYTLKFEAKINSIAGGIYYIRLLK